MKNQTVIGVSVLAAMIILVSAIPLAGQTTVGSVTGVVMDPTDAVIPGCRVTLTSLDTGVTREQATGSNGAFNFDRILPGTYTLRIERDGFRSQEFKDILVHVGKVTTIGPVRLQPGAPVEIVTVEATVAPLLQTDSPQLGGNYTSAQVSQLMWGAFGFDSIAFLTPGLQPGFANQNTNSGGFGAQFGGDPGATPAANGMRGRMTNITMDGQDNNDLSIGGPAFFVENPEIVAEFQVVTNQFSAELGRNAGATISIITKRGTNELHGSVFYLHENDAWLSSTKSDESQAGAKKPAQDIRHDWGFAFGGPAIKNRLFGYFTYHGVRNPSVEFTRSSTSELYVTPAGLATLAAAGFTGNTFDILRDNYGFARPLGNPQCLAGEPLQFRTVNTGMVSAMNVEFCRVTRLVPTTFRQFDIVARVDYEGAKDSVWARYFIERDISPNSSGDIEAGFGTDVTGRTQGIGWAWTHRFTSTMLNEFRFNWTRSGVFFQGGDTFDSADVFQNISRMDLASPFDDFGLPTNIPQFRVLPRWQWQDNWSLVRGRHTFKAGLELRQQRRTGFFLPSMNGNQVFRNTAGGFDSFENFLRNLPVTTEFTAGPNTSHIEEFDQFYYFQDDIRLRPNLTINLGLRYEFFDHAIHRPARDLLAREANPATAVWLQTVPLEQRTIPFLPADRNNWGPRIGFSYSPRWGEKIFGRDRTVIRGGFALSYDALFYNIPLNVVSSAPTVFAITCSGALCPPVPVQGAGTGAELQALLVPPVNTVDPRTLFTTVLADNFHNPYAMNWTLGIQREIKNTVAEIRYVGTRGIGLYQSINANPIYTMQAALFPETVPAALLPHPADTDGDGVEDVDRNGDGMINSQDGRVNPFFGNVRSRCNCARSEYHGLQTRWDFRNLFDQFTGGVGWTWSKNMDNVSEVFDFNTDGGSRAFQPNPFGSVRDEWARSNQDLRHFFTFHAIWDLPWHRSQQGWSKLAGGWQFSWTGFISSGRPWTPWMDDTDDNVICSENGDFADTFAGTATTCRPFDLGSGPSQARFVANGDLADPFLAALAALQGPFGGPRNPVAGDGAVIINMGIFKNTSFGPENRINAQFGAQIVNLPNHRNYGLPTGDIDSSIFGDEGQIEAAGRQVRLRLRISF
ncbi:MAG: carboxypeptidase regulatory-like domain-containing protein [Candidatus Acidiferrales bacterium]